MKFIPLTDLSIKVLTHYRQELPEYPELKYLNFNYLSFFSPQELSPDDFLESVSKISLFLKVWGKWKEYLIQDITRIDVDENKLLEALSKKIPHNLNPQIHFLPIHLPKAEKASFQKEFFLSK